MCWPSDTRNWEAKPFEYIEIAKKDPALWEYFVANTEGFINRNIQKKLGLANGTRIKYHSIVPQDEDQEMIIQNHLQNSAFGSILYLEKPPYAINVEIMDANIYKWNKFSMYTDKAVIPIFSNKSLQKWKTTSIMGGEYYSPSRVEIHSIFPLEPGFAITIHKAQGRTIEKVILCLSKRNMHRLNPTYAALYVALSRVKCKKDIRLFLHHGLSGKPDIEDLLFIDILKPDKSINAFFEGYKYDNTKWNATDALEKFNQN